MTATSTVEVKPGLVDTSTGIAVQDAATAELRRQARKALTALRQRKNLLRARFALTRSNARLYDLTILLGDRSRTLLNVKPLQLHDEGPLFISFRACDFDVATPSEAEWLRCLAAMLSPLQMEAA